MSEIFDLAAKIVRDHARDADMFERQAALETETYKRGMEAGRAMQKAEDARTVRGILAAYDMATRDRNARIPTILMVTLEKAVREYGTPK